MKKSVTRIQGTNDFNTVSKCSMIKSGYFKDNFVAHFVNKYNRRTPLIHLGYYMRILTVDFTLRSFIDAVSSQSAQIISFGAGFDTSYFRFAEAGCLHPKIIFYEVDFPEVIQRKQECILESESMLNYIGSYQVNHNGIIGLCSPQYNLIACDLQYLDKLESNLSLIGLDFQLPTLLLAECAICYMDEDSSSALIQWAASKFEDATFVTYEQVYPNDGFGIVMERHFESMNSPLLSLKMFPDLESQEQRYVSRGWISCMTWTAFEMFQQIVSSEERKKIVTLEPFDELEEWHLEGCHFGLMVASKGNLKDWFLKYANFPLDRTNIAKVGKSEIKWELLKVPTKQPVCRFAHKTVKVREEAGFDILIVGGFGPSLTSLHGRRHEVLSIICRHQSIANTPVKWCLDIEDVLLEDNVRLDALHQSCTHLSLRGSEGDARIMVYGGRYSPCKGVNSWPIILSVLCTETKHKVAVVKCEPAGVQQNIPETRWRHSAVCLRDVSNIQDNIAIFGGRTCEFKVLGDLHIWTVRATDLNIHYREIKQNDGSVNNKWPSARFSHSAAVWKGNIMVVTGGLGNNILPLSDIWHFHLETEMWKELSLVGMLPRYSHTSAIYGDQLILLGGVNTLPGNQPGICVVNLCTSTCTEYSLPIQDPENPI